MWAILFWRSWRLSADCDELGSVLNANESVEAVDVAYDPPRDNAPWEERVECWEMCRRCYELKGKKKMRRGRRVLSRVISSWTLVLAALPLLPAKRLNFSHVDSRFWLR